MSDLKMPNINQVAISGRLTRDCEFKILEGSKIVSNFNVAVNRNYQGEGGEWKQDTVYIPVSIWDKLAEALSPRLVKGSAVFITGRLRTRKHKNGRGERTSLELIARNVQFLDKKAEWED